MHPVPTIVFIDDGISPEFVPKGISFENYIVNDDAVQPSDPEHVVSHGTMCYQIFKNNIIIQSYHLISIKVLDSSVGTGNHKALLAALEWCAGQNIDIINMSMGTRQYTDFVPIAEAISRLSNVTIVAACSNQNELTFPACLPAVIGVRHCSHEALRGKHVFLSAPYDQIDVMTCANDMPISFSGGQDPVTDIGGTNSFATPIISARICDYMSQGHRGIDVIKLKLREDETSDFGVPGYDFYKKMFSTWQKLGVPVVGVIDDGHTYAKLVTVIAEFVEEGYRAIGLTAEGETNAAKLVYKLKWHGAGQVDTPGLINMYYNFTLPDVVFLHMPLSDLIALPEDVQADVLLKPVGGSSLEYDHWGEEYILDLDMEDLLVNIEKLLS